MTVRSRVVIWLVDHTPLGRLYSWNIETGFDLRVREQLVCRFKGHEEPGRECYGTEEWFCQRCFKNLEGWREDAASIAGQAAQIAPQNAGEAP